MIATSDFAEMAARLSARARLLGEAAAESRRLARKDPPSRWRKAVLLWPMFTKG